MSRIEANNAKWKHTFAPLKDAIGVVASTAAGAMQSKKATSLVMIFFAERNMSDEKKSRITQEYSKEREDADIREQYDKFLGRTNEYKG